jgi:pyruvate/2-oxoglutarate dehydrogenase complex dihydrolipoamide acyltransferase (E2) component
LNAPAAVQPPAAAEGDASGADAGVPAAPAPADRAVYGEGLARLLDLVAERMPKAEVEEVWAFPGVRREGREYGVAVITRRGAGDRRAVYRARYVLVLTGQDRGRATLAIEETAEAPAALLPQVLDGVRRRADEAGEAERVDLTAWQAHDAG